MTCTASDALSGLSGISYGNQTASAEGNTNLSCTATDVAGNIGEASYGVGIDTGSPMLDLIYSGTRGHSGWYITPVKIGVAASDGVSGIYSTGMQIDGGTWATSATVEDGEHYILARAEDNAGHVSTIDGLYQGGYHRAGDGLVARFRIVGARQGHAEWREQRRRIRDRLGLPFLRRRRRMDAHRRIGGLDLRMGYDPVPGRGV